MTAVATQYASLLREHNIPAIEGQPGAAVDHTPHLTAAIAAGDTVAFAAFYEVWFDRCFNIAAALTRRDESFCLDVVQDAMLRAIRSMRAMPRDDLERWMTRVVHTTALDALRAETRRAQREHRRALRRDEPPPDAAQLAELADQIDWLTRALADLDAEDRDLLGHRFTRGHTLADTGAATGLTGPAAHGRIRRALARLRDSARELFP